MILAGKTYYDTPIGTIELVCSERGLTHLAFTEDPTIEINPAHDHLLACIEQLDSYFAGERTHFTLFLDMIGTEFQQKVWHQLMNIPLGSTVTYGHVATSIQSPESARAVGDACRRNKLWLLVPCHRVIGADGQLTGYAGGVSRKRWLLDHEWSMLYGKQTALF